MPYGTGTYGSKVGRPKKKSMLSDDRDSYSAGAIVKKGIQAVKRKSDMKNLKKDIAEGLKLDDSYNTQLKELRSKNASDAKNKKVREDMISNIEDVALMQDMLKQLDEGVSSKGTSGKSKFGLDEDRSEFAAGGIAKKLIKEMREAKKILKEGKDYKKQEIKKLEELKRKNASKEELEDLILEMGETDRYIENSELTIKMLKEYPDKNPDILTDRIFVREQKSAGGILTKLFKLAKKEKPKKVKEQDIDRILDNLSDEQMEKLSPIEIEQLLDMDLAKSGVDNIPTKSTKKDIDKILGGLTDKEMENLSDIEIEQLLDMDLEKYGRKGKMKGGILDDERQTYGAGAIVKKLLKRKPSKQVEDIKFAEKELDGLIDLRNKRNAQLEKDLKDADPKSQMGLLEEYNDDYDLVTQRINKYVDELEELGVKPSKRNIQEKSRVSKADGGMLPDNDMEENYTRFIMDEALSEEEEDMLVTKLEQDKELQMLFDKVIDVAQEFAGNGPVEGPGTGVSDDIPARLSDGEFVFTAKAVEEIGEDNLMSMMKEAEAAADGRQGFAEGMMVKEKPQSMLSQTGIVQEDETGKGITEDMRKEVTKNIYS